MKKWILIAILFLSVGASAQLPVYLDDTKSIDERVDDALSRMTPDEKQLLAQTCIRSRSSGVPRLGIPPFVVDEKPNPLFPSVASLLNSWNPELLKKLGSYAAEQALYERIDAIGDAVPPEQGEDPYMADVMLSPYADAVRACGVAVKEDIRPFGSPQPQDKLLRWVLKVYFQTSMNKNRPMGFLGTEEQRSASRSMAEESVVLLKNDNGFLPLKDGASCKIWMVGGHPVEGLCDALKQQGIQADCQPCSFEEVSRNAGMGDIVLFTENFSDQTETSFLKKVPAILQTDDLGREGAKALAAILSGKVTPSGQLPFTWKGNDGKEPLFALGHGLSYTTFELSNLTQSGREIPADGDIIVSVTVTNTGDREGAATVQLYIHDIKTSLPKPDKILQGFKKVCLKPGESQEVSFPVNEGSLLFYDEDVENWVAEPGFYAAYVGLSMNNTPLKVRFHLK